MGDVAVAQQAKIAAVRAAASARKQHPPAEEEKRLRAFTGRLVLIPEPSAFQYALFFDLDTAKALLTKAMAGAEQAAIDKRADDDLDEWHAFRPSVNGEQTHHFFTFRSCVNKHDELKNSQATESATRDQTKLRAQSVNLAKLAFACVTACKETNLEVERTANIVDAALQRFCETSVADDASIDAAQKATATADLKRRSQAYLTGKHTAPLNQGIWTPLWEHMHRFENVQKVSENTGRKSVTFSDDLRQKMEMGVTFSAGKWMLHNAKDILRFCRDDTESGPGSNRLCSVQRRKPTKQPTETRVWGFHPDKKVEKYLKDHAAAKQSGAPLPANPNVVAFTPWKTIEPYFNYGTRGFEELVDHWQDHLTSLEKKWNTEHSGREKFLKPIKCYLSGNQERHWHEEAEKKRRQKACGAASSSADGGAEAAVLGWGEKAKKTRTSIGNDQQAASAHLGGGNASPSVAALQQECSETVTLLSQTRTVHLLLEMECLGGYTAHTGVHGFKAELHRCLILSPATVVSCDVDYVIGPSLTTPAWRDEKDTVSFADEKLRVSLSPWLASGGACGGLCSRNERGNKRVVATTASGNAAELLPYAAVYDAHLDKITVNYNVLHRYYPSVFKEVRQVLTDFEDALTGEHHLFTPDQEERWGRVCMAMSRRDDGAAPEEDDEFHLRDPLMADTGELLCERPVLRAASPLSKALAAGRIRPFRFFDHSARKRAVDEIAMLPSGKLKARAKATQLVWECCIRSPGKEPKWIIYLDGEFLQRVQRGDDLKYVRMVLQPGPDDGDADEEDGPQRLVVRDAGYQPGDSDDEDEPHETSSLDYMEGKKRTHALVEPLIGPMGVEQPLDDMHTD